MRGPEIKGKDEKEETGRYIDDEDEGEDEDCVQVEIEESLLRISYLHPTGRCVLQPRNQGGAPAARQPNSHLYQPIRGVCPWPSLPVWMFSRSASKVCGGISARSSTRFLSFFCPGCSGFNCSSAVLSSTP